METRLIIAYTLIALMVAAVVALGVFAHRKREKERRFRSGRYRNPS